MKIFWSWQSDTPGKISRHLIRAAILDAIQELKQSADVEEPTERDVREAIHLDHDREGVSGSPDLAPLILDKIARSTVLIADVTPVATIAAHDDREEKRIMNSNVAIELGYGMHALSDRRILMVLNTHFGGRNFLPFDLAHKAGPIIYNLAPGANADTIAAARKSLKQQFSVALRPFIATAATAAPAFQEMPHGVSRAVYFNETHVLGCIGEEEEEDKVEFVHPNGKGFYLRVMPTEALHEPIPRAELHRFIRQNALGALWRQPSGMFFANRFGAAVIEPDSVKGGKITAITQVFPNGEIWGFAPWLLVSNHLGRYIPVQAFETVYRDCARRYVELLQKLGANPPYVIEAGAVGVDNHFLFANPLGDDQPGVIYDEEINTRLVLNTISDQAMNEVLLRFFEGLYRAAGSRRPLELFGFPPKH